MLEVTTAEGEIFYLPMHLVKIIRKNPSGEAAICHVTPKGGDAWVKIASFSVLTTSKKISF